MAEEKKTTTTRKKPGFLRKDWHKYRKLGKNIKSKRKWRAAKGRQNKIRLGVKGHQARPKVGWSADAKIKGFVGGMEAVRVENMKEMEAVKKGHGVIIGAVGKKKKMELIAKANEMKITILNKYRKAAKAEEKTE
jgi:ribosomal protein L32E